MSYRIGERLHPESRLRYCEDASPQKSRVRMLVLCDCGTFKVIYAAHAKKIKSCGCYRREFSPTLARTYAHPAVVTHGDSKSGPLRYLYKTWSGIKYRTMKADSQNWDNYGGRGIGMYEPWKGDYQAFKNWILANLGERPEGYSLDRVDNDGNYEPGNLRWATRSEQRANQRKLVNQ